MKRILKNAGFTIMELIIAVGLLGAVTIGTGAYLSNSFKDSNKVVEKAEVKNSVTALMNKLETTIKTADIPVLDGEIVRENGKVITFVIKKPSGETVEVKHNDNKKVVKVDGESSIEYSYIDEIDVTAIGNNGVEIAIKGINEMYAATSICYTRNTIGTSEIHNADDFTLAIDWFDRSPYDKRFITEINIISGLNKAELTGNNWWDADEKRTGAIKCYVKILGENQILTIAANGNSAIKLNSNSSNAFADFSNVTRINGMQTLNSANVADMSYMFDGCSNLKELDLISFDTQMVTDMSNMFKNCSSLESIKLETFNTQKVEYMNSMFENCTNLKNISLSNFDTSSVKDMSRMFYECDSIKTLYLDKFDTSSVKDMLNMFYNMDNVEEIRLSECFDFGDPRRCKFPTGTWYTMSGGEYLESNIPTKKKDTYYSTRQVVKIVFNEGKGKGTMSPQLIKVNSHANLKAVQFSREGYNFVGWNTKPDDTGTDYKDKAVINVGDEAKIELYAVDWAPKKYIVRLEPGKKGYGGGTINVLYEGKYEGIDNVRATRKGYTFDGWYTSENGGTKVTETTDVTTARDHTLYAQWTPNQYQVRYELNGGSSTEIIMEKVVIYDQAYGTLLKDVTKVGYEFDGWYTAIEGGAKVDETTIVEIPNNHTLYAHWKSGSYEVILNLYENAELKNVIYSKTVYVRGGGTARFLIDKSVKRFGYTHYGWTEGGREVFYNYNEYPNSKSLYLNSEYYVKSNVVENTKINLYPVWKDNVVVEYDANKGNDAPKPTVSIKSQNSLTEEVDITISSVEPTREGYTFIGWGKTASDKTPSYQPEETVKFGADTKIYAVWDANEYKVHYDKNKPAKASENVNGEIEDTDHEYDQPSKLSERYYTLTGWEQIGWNTKADGTGTSYDFEDAGEAKYEDKTVLNLTAEDDKTVTLYAMWKPYNYIVEYDSNKPINATGTMEGEIEDTKHIYDHVSPLSTYKYTLTGWTFNGWNTVKDGAGTAYSVQDFGKVKNGVDETVLNLTAEDDKTVTLYAQWTANTYAIELDPTGGDDSVIITSTDHTTNVTATYDSAMPTMTKPERKYTVTYKYNGGSGDTETATSTYKWLGYYDGKNGEGTSYYASSGASARTWDKTADTTLYARWKADSNAEVTLPTPTRTGYTFNGWYSDSTKVGDAGDKYIPTNHIELTAHWTANKYTVTLDGQNATSTNHTTSVTATYDSDMPTLTTAPSREYTVTFNYNGNGTANTTAKSTYTFAGYYDGTGGSGTKYYNADKSSARTWNKASDTKLYAKWTDGGVTLPTPTRTGYTFAGWWTASSGGTQRSSGYAATQNETLYAHWTANTYAIELDPTGGDDSVIITSTDHTTNVTATYDSDMPTLTTAPSREYTVTFNYNGNGTANTTAKSTYTFAGYYDGTGGSGTKYYNADKSSARTWNKASDTKLYAKWTDGGVTLPTPTRTGYTFAGWWTASSGGTQRSSGYAATQNETLYAHWTANTYTVTLAQTDATTVGTTSVIAIYDSAMPTPITKPSRVYTVTYNYNGNGTANTTATSTYTFGGYYDGTNGSGTQYYTSAGASARTWNKASDATLHPKWTSASVTLPTPTRTGYTFNGWYNGSTKAGNGGASYTPAGNVTLTASWTANEYTVTYDANSGSVSPASKKVTYDSTYGDLATPTRSYSYTVTYNANGGSVSPTSATSTRTDTFNGWYKSETNNNGSGTKVTSSSKVSTASDHYLYANWTENGYSAVTLPSPTRTGYTFNGWYNGSTKAGTGGASYIPTGDVTLTASWTANEYTVTYDANSGSVSPASKKVTYDSTYGDLATPTRSYSYTVTYNANGGSSCSAGTSTRTDTFNGWYKSETNNNGSGTKVTSSSKVSTASDHYLYANWTENGYSAVTLPSPTRTGYTFNGWYNGSTKAGTGGASYTPSGNITLTASWTANEYTVTNDPNGGSVSPASKKVTYDSTYGDLATPTRSYSYTVTYDSNGGSSCSAGTSTRTDTFNGWYLSETSNNGSGAKITADSTVSTANDHTIYANWTANGNSAVTLPSPTRSGYTFNGWYNGSTKAGNGGASYTPTGNVTLTANWIANTYYVTFDPNGGACHMAGTEVTFDEIYGVFPTPERIGYTFNGWYTAAEGGTKIEETTPVLTAADHTLYAQWTANEYILIYNANGGSGAPSSHWGINLMIKTEEPTRTGYNFLGWADSSSATSAQYTAGDSITLTEYKIIYAVWEECTHSNGYTDGVCDECGYECRHNWRYSYTGNRDGGIYESVALSITHKVERTCILCQKEEVINNAVTCTTEKYVTYTELDDDYHRPWVHCATCESINGGRDQLKHNYVDYICTDCGARDWRTITLYYEDYDEYTLFDYDEVTTKAESATFIITSVIPTKEGYTFSHWEDRDTERMYWGDDEITISTDTTLYAAWEEGGSSGSSGGSSGSGTSGTRYATVYCCRACKVKCSNGNYEMDTQEDDCYISYTYNTCDAAGSLNVTIDCDAEILQVENDRLGGTIWFKLGPGTSQVKIYLH